MPDTEDQPKQQADEPTDPSHETGAGRADDEPPTGYGGNEEVEERSAE